MNPTQQAIIMLIATAISAVAAVFSWRAASSANKIARDSKQPILRGEYDLRNDNIVLKNYGNGPALNMNMRPNLMYESNSRKKYAFRFSDGCVRSLMPNEENVFEIELVDVTNTHKENNEFDNGFAAYELFFSYAKSGDFSIICYDLYGRMHRFSMKSVNSNGKFIFDAYDKNKYYMNNFLWDKLSIWVSSRKLLSKKSNTSID